MRTPILAAAFASLLAGCTLAPKYVAPESPAPEAWPVGPAYQYAAGDCGARLAWREFLVDPGLAQVVELALASNRDLRLAALNVERARALYGIQRHELYPAVYASGGGGRQRASSESASARACRSSAPASSRNGIAPKTSIGLPFRARAAPSARGFFSTRGAAQTRDLGLEQRQGLAQDQRGAVPGMGGGAPAAAVKPFHRAAGKRGGHVQLQLPCRVAGEVDQRQD